LLFRRIVRGSVNTANRLKSSISEGSRDQRANTGEAQQSVAMRLHPGAAGAEMVAERRHSLVIER
jgi:hypothetical protein